MQFFAPTRVYLEKDCVANHKNELLSYGSRAFIITGKHSSKANGSLDDVLSILDEASVPYLIYNDIEENPSVETVTKAAGIGKTFRRISSSASAAVPRWTPPRPSPCSWPIHRRTPDASTNPKS